MNTNGSVQAARHAEAAASTPGHLVWRMVRAGRVHAPAMLLSDFARDLLVRRYDAFVTDRAYADEPSGRWGAIGRAVDAHVLRYPLHEALRRRLDLVVQALTEQIDAQGARPVRVLSAPCGLARDLVRASARVPTTDVSWTGADLDAGALAEAARRAAASGLALSLHEQDLLGPPGDIDAMGRPYHIASCIGLTAWLDLTDVSVLARRFHGWLEPGGVLVVDNWRAHKHSKLGRYLEIPTRYHPEDDFAHALDAGGFDILDRRAVPNGITTVWIARRR